MDPPRIEAKPTDYHIQVAGVSLIRTPQQCKQKIKQFLAALFDPKGSGLENSPLKFSGCTFSAEHTPLASTRVIWVKLDLTEEAERAHTSLDEAAKSFCEHSVDPKGEGSLKALTPLGLLGISALSGTFKRLWTQTLFRDYLVHGPRILKTIDSAFDEYLPQWALPISYAVAAGLNFGIFRDPASGSPDPEWGFSKEGVDLASSILKKYTEKIPPGELEQEWSRAWKQVKLELRDSMSITFDKLQEMKSIGNIQMSNHRHQMNLHYAVCDALYEVTLADAHAFTSNQEMLQSFLRTRAQMIENAAMMGGAAATLAYPGVVVQLTTFGVCGSTAAGSASTMWGTAVATEAAVSWGVAQITTLSTTLWFAAPAIITGGVLYTGMRYYQKRQASLKREQRARYLEQANNIIAQAWGLAHDTHHLLKWIHVPDKDTLSVDFRDDDSRAKWDQFIRAVKGSELTSSDLEPGTVLTYIDGQLQQLRVSFHGVLALQVE